MTSTEAKENIDAATILYQKWITTTIPEKTSFYESLTRKDAAILLKRFAENILRKSPEISTCTYSDIEAIPSVSEQNEVLQACNMGLFKAWILQPFDYFTHGQLVTVVARMISSNPRMEKADAYDYLLHLWIVKVDDKLQDTMFVPRKDIYGMLQRIIVSLSQLAAYSPYMENFTVGNTIWKNNQLSLGVQDSASKVYKVMVYKKNKIYGNYELLQLGSAVVVAPGMLITNAHVIYNDNEEVAYNDIEICKTDAKTNKVHCFTTATVQYYDKDKDLALLKVADSKSLSAPVQLASQAPRNGDVLNVWWYPGIWGQSITFTKWIISGIERDKYKSDVKIDHGNSGGGAFNKKGELVGIPNSAEVDTDTLSYIIPYETVKAFLNKKWDIVTNTGSSEASFVTYIRDLQIAKNTSIIQNPIFSIKDIGNYVLDDYSFDNARNLHNLSISTQDSTLSITINNDLIIGSGQTKEQKDKTSTESLKKCESSNTWNLLFQGKTWTFYICTKYYGWSSNVAYASYEETLYPIHVSFLSNNSITQKSLEDMLRKVSLGSGTNLASFNPYTIGPVTFPQLSSTSLLYSINDWGSIDAQLIFSHDETIAQGALSIAELSKSKFDIQTKWKSYLGTIKDSTDFYTNAAYFNVLLSGWLYKNSLGSTFFILANATKAEDIAQGEKATRTISVLAYTKKDEKIYYFGIDFSYKGEQDIILENQIMQYINTIKLDGVIPFVDIGGGVSDVSSISLSK
jgi:hypothetical protein